MAIASAILCLSLCAPCRASGKLWEALGRHWAISRYLCAFTG
uniref:Uncharacterized protein n=1 Tax=Klebsiella phage Hope TaxID=3350564 RepID=A0AB74UPI6_9CAUD